MPALSGFGDEISTVPDEQLAVLVRAGVHRLDLRGACGRNVLDLTDADIAQLSVMLARQGVSVSCVATPVGKAPIDGDFAQQQAALARTIEVAQALGTMNLRVFSYYMPDGAAPEQFRDEVLRRLAGLIEQADRVGMTLLHENERGIYGDSPERCHDLHATLDSPRFLALWDPGNFASCGYRPYHDSWELLRAYIGYVHVKDFNRSSGRVVVAGAGDAEWPECLRALRDSGYDGILSLEPHLAHAGKAGGFTGPDLFIDAVNALRELMVREGFDPTA